MKIKLILAIAFTVFGLISGKGALLSAQAAKPPIDWSAIQIIFVFCILAMVIVIGFQILRNNPMYANGAITFMLIPSLYFFSSGISALIISGAFTPESTFIFIIGAGSLIGLGLSIFLNKWRHGHNP